MQAISLLEIKRTDSYKQLQNCAFLPPKKRKFVRLSSQISLSSLGSLSANIQDENDSVCVDISLEDENPNNRESNSNAAPHCDCQCSVPPLGSFPKVSGVMPVASISPVCTSSSQTTNCSTETVSNADGKQY